MKKLFCDLQSMMFSFYNFHHESQCYDIMLEVYESLHDFIFQKSCNQNNEKLLFKNSYSELEKAKTHITKMKRFQISYYLQLLEEYIITVQKIEKKCNQNDKNKEEKIKSLQDKTTLLKQLIQIRKNFLLERKANLL